MSPWSSKLDGNGSRETSKGFSRPSDFPSFVLCGVGGGGYWNSLKLFISTERPRES